MHPRRTPPVSTLELPASFTSGAHPRQVWNVSAAAETGKMAGKEVDEENCGAPKHKKKHSGEIIPGVVVVPFQRRESIERRTKEEKYERHKILCGLIEIPTIWEVRRLVFLEFVDVATDIYFLTQPFAHSSAAKIGVWISVILSFLLRTYNMKQFHHWMMIDDRGSVKNSAQRRFKWNGALVDIFSMAATVISYHEIGASFSNRLSFFCSCAMVMPTLAKISVYYGDYCCYLELGDCREDGHCTLCWLAVVIDLFFILSPFLLIAMMILVFLPPMNLLEVVVESNITNTTIQ